MPRSTSLDAYPSFRPPTSLEDHPRAQDAHAHDLTSSFPRAFPIRTSQSHRRAAPLSSSPYPPRSKHHLRRKTPNGTIDAAYDGSLRPPAPGPPPRKHMIVPTGPGAGSYAPTGAHHHHHPSQRAWSAGPRVPNHSGQVEPNTGPWTFNEELSGQYGPHQGSTNGLHPYQPSLLAKPSSFPNVYQPVIRANEYNVRAFCPPPMPTSEALPFGQSVWQPDPLFWGYQCVRQFPTIPSNPTMPGKLMMNVDLCHERPQLAGHNYPAGLEYAYGFGQPPHLNMEGLTLDSGMRSNVGAHIAAPTVQLGFREKALAQAHKAYMDLLTHLQSTRKSQQDRMGSRSLVSKVFVYPKPPNPVSITATGGAEAAGAHDSTQRSSSGGNNGQIVPFESNRGYVLGNTDQQIHQVSGFSTQQGTLFGANCHHGPESTSPFGAIGNEHVEEPHPLVAFHPVARARSSLEILNTLCEQSGWKWLEGILLGGCLHYGLENYETALEWFLRTAACDPR